MRLILFDVDGTLVDAHGAGSRALLAALDAVYRRPFDRNGVAFAGRTDRAIVTDLLRANGLGEGRITEGLKRVFAELPGHMQRETGRTPATACPGVVELLAALQGVDNLMLGLLTGNLAPTAEIKLLSAGILPALFAVGAFGDEAVDRNQLPPLALQRARVLSNSQIDTALVVGDTPADIACARAHQLPVLAVATGPFTPAQLETHQATYVLPDLTDLGRTLEIMLR